MSERLSVPLQGRAPTNDCIPEAIMTSDLAWAVQWSSNK